MSPALIRELNVEPSESSASNSARGAKTMYISSSLHPRSPMEADSDDGSNGVEGNTIIFIVIGVVCFFVILIGFYRVSRPRVEHNVAPRTPSPLSQHSPVIPPPPPLHLRRERDMSQTWKIWGKWRHTRTASLPTAPGSPVAQVSPVPVTITNPSPAVLSTNSSNPGPPPSAPRPEQSRRVTSLSVTTSFSHSHITEEVLNDFRVSAYDLDGDLETEMLNSARDEFWWGHPFAVEEVCENGMSLAVEEEEEESEKAGCNAILVSDGGFTPPKVITTECGDGYENEGSGRGVGESDSGGVGDEGDVGEKGVVAVSVPVLNAV